MSISESPFKFNRLVFPAGSLTETVRTQGAYVSRGRGWAPVWLPAVASGMGRGTSVLCLFSNRPVRGMQSMLTRANSSRSDLTIVKPQELLRVRVAIGVMISYFTIATPLAQEKAHIRTARGGGRRALAGEVVADAPQGRRAVRCVPVRSGASRSRTACHPVERTRTRRAKRRTGDARSASVRT